MRERETERQRERETVRERETEGERDRGRKGQTDTDTEEVELPGRCAGTTLLTRPWAEPRVHSRSAVRMDRLTCVNPEQRPANRSASHSSP